MGSPDKLGKKAGEADIICSYMALCQPLVDEDFNKIEAPKNLNEATQVMMMKSGRMSMIMCKGKASYMNGFLCTAQGCPPVQCPTLTECQKDIFFNGVMGPVASAEPAKVLVAPTNTETTK